VADQLVFSGLTREQADATKQFHEDNGATAEIIPDGPTLFSVLVAYPASAPADGPTSAFVQNIVGIANRQWDFFGDQTFDLAGRTTLVGHKEGEDGWYQRVGEYWLEGTGTHGVDGRDHNMFWSAAFISWVMKTGGAGDRFRYSTLHSVYIFQAIRDHLQNRTAAGFWAWRLDEIKPKVGDHRRQRRQLRHTKAVGPRCLRFPETAVVWQRGDHRHHARSHLSGRWLSCRASCVRGAMSNYNCPSLELIKCPIPSYSAA
jgi:Uncharacterized protein conserved in bacteria (DUF2272)